MDFVMNLVCNLMCNLVCNLVVNRINNDFDLIRSSYDFAYLLISIFGDICDNCDNLSGISFLLNMMNLLLSRHRDIYIMTLLPISNTSSPLTLWRRYSLNSLNSIMKGLSLRERISHSNQLMFNWSSSSQPASRDCFSMMSFN